MGQTIEDLMELGFTKAEAERAINRKAKAAEKNEKQKALAEQRLPKAQEQLDHAAGRVEHWQGKAEAAQKKIDRYTAIISGDSDESVEDVEGDVEAA